ncbi:cytochrome b/b6 domain-containing protein [Beggiatoa leptomitoformis]|uniref:Cytochrome b561 bacterial/Ni-hydrogenase domain-containing protein n=1 Tax=Beggiatoa leptomitoformis TaxID=288004 RepID=A0A2N9YE20_9GAMM|nr:cytochrome b/b6 domain-containing protein [Beggiatoa leptomitoformis]AUI68696.1 hypothetical protein BLE401_08260 [Beggiatoa leptomitoformis]QGX03807.1 hypothetical protein AL038_19420 [Beggiatoa leptomitoformis]
MHVDSLQVVRVWDLPTRLFHWLFALSFAVAWFTHGDDRYLHIHLFAGYVFFALLVFRLIWGVIGSYYARFTEFAYSIPTVLRYLQTLLTAQRVHYLGHNPIGGWAVFLLLSLAFTIVATGFLTQWGEEQHGILAGWFSFNMGGIAHKAHKVVAWLMLGAIAVHVAGVLAESIIHDENLVQSMISGYKISPVSIKHPIVSKHFFLASLLVITLVASGVFYFWGYFQQTADKPYIPIQGVALPINTTWQAECGACHLAYPPALLPARSWQLLLTQTSAHFNDDLALEPDTLAILQAFAQANAAEKQLSEAAWHINRSTPATQTPQRITDTYYWQTKHASVPDAYWQLPLVKQKANCAACHLDAEQGTFEDGAMHYPAIP